MIPAAYSDAVRGGYFCIVQTVAEGKTQHCAGYMQYFYKKEKYVVSGKRQAGKGCLC